MVAHAGQVLHATTTDQHHASAPAGCGLRPGCSSPPRSRWSAAPSPPCAVPSSASSASSYRRAYTRHASADSPAAPAPCSVIFCGSRPLAMSWFIVGIAPLSSTFGRSRRSRTVLDRQSPPAGSIPSCGSWSPRPGPAGLSGGGAARDFGLQTTAARQPSGRPEGAEPSGGSGGCQAAQARIGMRLAGTRSAAHSDRFSRPAAAAARHSPGSPRPAPPPARAPAAPRPAPRTPRRPDRAAGPPPASRTAPPASGRAHAP